MGGGARDWDQQTRNPCLHRVRMEGDTHRQPRKTARPGNQNRLAPWVHLPTPALWEVEWCFNSTGPRTGICFDEVQLRNPCYLWLRTIQKSWPTYILTYVFFLYFSPLGLVVSGGFCVHDAVRAGDLSAMPLSAHLHAPFQRRLHRHRPASAACFTALISVLWCRLLETHWLTQCMNYCSLLLEARLPLWTKEVTDHLAPLRNRAAQNLDLSQPVWWSFRAFTWEPEVFSTAPPPLAHTF